MISWIRRLPDDIIREYILPYTYQPQSPELCKDIQTYYTTLQELSDVYKKKHTTYKNEDKEWLLYDIIVFMNNHTSIVFGYTDNYIQWFRRLYMLQNASRDQIIQLSKSSRWYFTRKIYGHIALMKPSEREDLKSCLMVDACN